MNCRALRILGYGQEFDARVAFTQGTLPPWLKCHHQAHDLERGG